MVAYCHKSSARMEGTVFAVTLEELRQVKSEGGEILTKPFLDVFRHMLPVVDKFGPSMVLVKSDVLGNISTLESKYKSNPSEFNDLYNMVRLELEAKKQKSSSSCTTALLWLTRGMDFLLELFRNLLEHADWTMSQACTSAYKKTLKKWHGFLERSSFSVALKVIPDRKKFMDIIGGTGDINSDIEQLCTNFAPLLEENHRFLASIGMDDWKF
ncbi:glycolipid transfer protein 1-like [Malania oleifera]|uniref:glycolipid transfer protein 1-like n=1 Tax=Malania oleifera TaxID=397392 RepID=UPI0025ADD176|nr:glycolipid transfer protein 1-like [Malania oleifera]